MLKKPTTLFLITLIVGLIYGCGGSTNPFIDEAKSSLKSNNPNGVLQAAEKSIQNRPGDPLGYYYKGVALGDLAADEPVGNRMEKYKEMNSVFSTAMLVSDTSTADTPDEINRIADVKINLWRTEYLQGVEYATNDSLMQATTEPLKIATSHLKNATTINPDSSNSWDALAQIAYMDQNFDLAIEAKENSIKRMDSPTEDDYKTLVAYYANNDNLEGALGILEKAVEQYPNSLQLTSNLADAYRQAGQNEKSIQTVQKLVDQNPENPQFHLALGKQVYRNALKINDKITENYDEIYTLEQKIGNASSEEKSSLQNQVNQLEAENASMQKEYDQLAAKAENELKQVIEYRPDDADAYNTLGIIYQNKASALFDERNNTDDNAKAAKLNEKGKQELQQAMTYYEKAAEIDPENQDYWNSLFSIYTTLGMDEKADEAMKKAGIDQ